MNQQTTKVGFSASDNGISSFIKKLRDDSKQLYKDMAKDAKDQTSSQKEQLRLVEQQIRALERQNRLEKEQNLLLLERKRSLGGLSDSNYTKGIAGIRSDDAANRMQISLLKEMFDNAKGNQGTPQQQNSTAQQVFTGVLGAEIVKTILSTISRMSSASNEFDMVGQIPFMAPVARHLQVGEQYYSTRGRVRGLGSRTVAPDMQAFGLDRLEATTLQEMLMRSVGGDVSARTIKMSGAISKGYGVDQSEIGRFLGLKRTGADVREDHIIGLLSEGIDRSRLTDAISSTVSLMQQMSASTLSPSRLDAIQKISEFNRIGGPFAVGDPRSMQLMSVIQSNLTSPRSALSQAMSYSVLRGQNPDANWLDLMMERQKGSSVYMRGMMEGFAGLPVSKDLQIAMFAQEMGLGGNLAAAKKLFENRGKIAGGGTQLNTMSSDEQRLLYQEAAGMTSTMEQGTAAVTNAFIEGVGRGLEVLAKRFAGLVDRELGGIITDAPKASKDFFSGNSKVYWPWAGLFPQKNGE